MVKRGRDYNQLIDCHCGYCGLKRLRWDIEGREHLYINGHFWKNRKHSKESVQKMIDYRTGRQVPKTQRENHWNYKGGYIDDEGYKIIPRPNHFSKKLRKNYVLEHRYNYEVYYNCCVLPWIHVHHINGNKLDNRIENLKTMTKSEHHILHNRGRKVIKKSIRNSLSLDKFLHS